VEKFSRQLTKLFEDFEHRKVLSETEASDLIGKEIRKLQDANEEPTLETRADWAAFAFMANSSEERSSWGTYFGPMAIFKSEDGRVMESPSLDFISEEILGYWGEQSQRVGHPVLRARYADLAWDFARPLKQSPQIRHVHIAIDAYLDAVQSDQFEHEITAITYVRRALQLGISTNDVSRIERARHAIIELERKIRKLGLLGTWGFAFDLLVENRKSQATDEQCRYLVADLEQILQNVVDSQDFERYDPFIAESAALRLASCYRRLNRLKDAHRVLHLYAHVFATASEKVAPLQAQGWLRRVYGRLARRPILKWVRSGMRSKFRKSKLRSLSKPLRLGV